MAKKQTPKAKKQISKEKKGKPKPFQVVAIGASAGGLEATSELVKNIPHNTGMAFVYIQHLDPNHESMLSEILGRMTKMKVQNAKHLLSIEPNNIYVIPPNKNLSIIDGVLKLDTRQPKPFINMPVDKFFKSLAEVYKELAIGVVLSGNAHDGTIGLKAIKNAGGFTFAQDETAKFGSMPKSAISEGCVDMVLPPIEIAHQLERISKNTSVINTVLKGPEYENSSFKDEELGLILELLRKSVGVDFHHYKTNTIKRRILRRMLLNRVETLDVYHEFLKKHRPEVELLFQDLLINVTSFFRDEATMEYLKKTLLPKIVKGKPAEDSFRIWIPACSTGEEAYSLAMILTELLGDKGLIIPIQIFATDLSEKAIEKARTGLYSRGEVENITPKRLQRFFSKVEGHYRIHKSIRDLCIFAPHNVFANPPFLKLDLVSCCNLLIYLRPVLQKKLLAVFHYSLRPSGYLLLGKSENLGDAEGLFSQVEKRFKVFQRKNDVSNKVKFELNPTLPELRRKGGGNGVNFNTPNRGQQVRINLDRKVEEILLSRYVSASVLVSNDLEILQSHGPVNSFLEIMPGKASLNLLKLVRTGLVFDLRNIINKANRSNKTVRKSGIEIRNSGSFVNLAIEVVPLEEETGDKIFLVVFEKLREDSVEEKKKASLTKDQLVKKLQLELETAKEDMRSILEEHEASNEELQSANEEIVSSNEELQSINEELETSKEEVESSVEELHSINNELQVRNEQLAESHEYSEAISETIREAVLVLDRDFRVRTANKAFYRIFKTREEETEGMLIYELGNRQWDILELRQLLEEILVKRNVISGFEVEYNFPLIGHKIMLLHARTIIQKVQQKQLIVLAIEDISSHRMAQRAAEERELWFRTMADNAPSIIWIAGSDKKITFLNKTWYEFAGKTHNAGDLTQYWKESMHPDDVKKYERVFDKSFDGHTTLSVEYRLRRADGEYRWLLDVGKPNYSNTGQFLGYIGSSAELHDRKLMLLELDKQVRQRTQELKLINNELQRSNNELEQFAFVASHDLQEPLRKILTYIDRIRNAHEKLSDTGSGYFEKIDESAKRMTKLIDDLLSFSSISFSNKKFIRIDLSQVITDVISDMELLIAEKKAQINVDERLAVVEGEQVQLSQLFHNLIGNALKFAKEGVPPAIRISCKVMTEEEKTLKSLDGRSPYIELTIVDNGIGFDPVFAEQIFIIFQRLNAKKKYPGTGIGLALCRRIVTNHGGLIFANSSSAGSEFHVILPMRQEKKDE